MNNFGSAFDTFPSGITLPARSEVLLKGVGQTTRIPLPACASPAHRLIRIRAKLQNACYCTKPSPAVYLLTAGNNAGEAHVGRAPSL